MNDQRWIIRSVYAAIANRERDKTQLGRIGEITREETPNGSRLLIAGDMIAHIRQLDGRLDCRGKLPLEPAEQHDLTN